MRYIPIIAGLLLGLLFAASGLTFLLGMIPPMPAPPPGSFEELFMGALIPSGYMAMVKVFEVCGGVLVAIPRTRALGLLILGPIIINVIAFHVFIMHGVTLIHPVNAVSVVLPLYLLWVERKAFGGLLRAGR